MFFFFKQKTAYEMRISDWSSDVCSSDLARHRERAGVAAVGIVGAADEAAVAPATQAETAGTAGRAAARVLVRVRRVGGEEVRPEVAVERIDHLGDREVAGAGHGGAEGLPEVAQHAAPVDASAGDVVETLLHLGGEVVLHVALEE